MPEELTTPDLVAAIRERLVAAGAGNVDVFMRGFAPNARWEIGGLGIVFEGAGAIRSFVEEWIGAYEEFAVEIEEVRQLGSDVTFAVYVQHGRPLGASGEVRSHVAQIAKWDDALIVEIVGYNDIDEARAAAERLAEERRS
jgi:hypothetical protein